MLGRGTFYLHYKDIHDLLDTLENEYVEAIGNIIDEYYPIAPAANISNSRKTIPLHHRPRRTAPPSLPPHFHTKLHRPPDYPPTLRIQPSGGRRGCDAAYNAVETSFMISGFAGVILDYWFLGSLPLSEKEIIHNLNRLLLNFSRAKKEMKRGGSS